MTDGPLDVSIDQLKRVLDNQMSSVNNLKAQVGVLLGFAATSLVVLFSFGKTWVTANVALASAAAFFLLASIAIFGATLRLSQYRECPKPEWLVGLLNNGTGAEALKEELVANFWGAYDENKAHISRQFGLVNVAIPLLVIGVGIFVVGVIVT